MRSSLIYGLVMALLFLCAPGCSSVPVTGRQQLNIIPASQMMSMSYQQYGEFPKANKLSTDKPSADMVRRVGRKIQNAVEQFMASQNLSARLQGYQWEFNLVESKEVNAWCMPGGKVVVYTGLLAVTKGETGLAVVLGHEIAHAIAEHGDERMSQGLLAELGGAALDQALSSKPAQTRELWMSTFNVGVQYGALLPYSRTHESEADHLGLIFMAIAGYDPNAALSFWQRMAAQGGQKPPEFMSTHPSDETRIKNIRDELPEALRYYRKG